MTLLKATEQYRPGAIGRPALGYGLDLFPKMLARG
jgi:hypothetical protein